MKAVENLKDYFSIVIKAAITPVKLIDSCCGDTVSDKALVVGVIVGIMYPPSDFLGVSKPNGCQDQVIFHLRLAVSSITQYISGYYNRYRPHQHNGGRSPLVTEGEYRKTHNGLVSFSVPLQFKGLQDVDLFIAEPQ